jgi:glycosyltransferase 2 family protein
MFNVGSSLSLLFRAIVSLAILFYLSQKIEWQALQKHFFQVDFYFLLAALAIIGLAFFAAAVRWYFLMQIQGIRLPLKVVTLLTFIGTFFNAFFLGSTGGDVAKLVYIFKAYPDKKTDATLSLFIDRVLGLACLLLLASIFIAFKIPLFIEMTQIHIAILSILGSFLLLIATAIFMLKMPFEKLPPFFHRWWQKLPRQDILRRLLQGCRQHGHNTKTLAYAFMASAMVQLTIFVAAYWLARSINLNIGFIDLAIIITIVTCVTSLPISIGGHGVREGTFLVMFSLFAAANNSAAIVDPEKSVLFSLLYFSIVAAWGIIGGVIYLFVDPLKTISYTNNPINNGKF